MTKRNSQLLAISAVLLLLLLSLGVDALEENYYNGTCPGAEVIVREVVYANVANNATLAAKLLRLFFHDCFVRGCDASVLLDSTGGNAAEKDAPPNKSLGGFEVIDEAKSALEAACEGVVSCADVLALAARDAVSFPFNRSMWPVLTGRKDGRVSLESEAVSNLPSPASDFSTLALLFAGKGLGTDDLVVLSGAHTIGVSHCGVIDGRLYNFSGRGDTDPSIDPAYAAYLKTLCGPTDVSTEVAMDPGSSLSFDNHYYVVLRQHEGLFQSDAALLTDGEASDTVDRLAGSQDQFFSSFSDAITKMGNIGALAGLAGEIRANCHVVN